MMPALDSGVRSYCWRREAKATGAELLVTACPKCQIHFRCAMDDARMGEEIEMEVRDLVTLVAEGLGIESPG